VPGSDLLILIAIGFFAGGMGAMLGVGGGVILVPGLILVAGLPFQSAVGASLVCVVATSVSGSIVYLRRRLVNLRLGVELQVFTVIGAVGAGLVAPLVPAAPLHFAFAALMLAATLRMWPREKTAPEQPHAFSEGRRRTAAAVSVGAGAVSGLLGVGGGILNVPILHVLLGMRFDRAVATSVYIFGLTAAAAAIVYYARGDVDVTVAGAAVIGTAFGAACGAYLADKVNRRLLQAVFAALLLYVGVRMVMRGIALL
jgi:uncharacterized membrane protein YfcA